MKVGIDLSSTNTGLVILSDDNKLIFHGNFNLWDKNYGLKINNIDELVFAVYAKNISNEKIHFGIELSNFNNANITNRFNFIWGAICYVINKTFTNYECRAFNSNEWQNILWKEYSKWILVNTHIVNGKKTYKYSYIVEYSYETPHWSKREMLKFLSRKFTQEHCEWYLSDWTEDECDAYCIAYWLEHLRNQTQIHQEAKTKQITLAKSRQQAKTEANKKLKHLNKLKDIVIKYKSMSKLTKAQQRALEKAESELKEYEKENC